MNELYRRPVVVFDLDDTLYSERDYVLSGFRSVGSLLGDPEAARKMTEAWESGKDPYAATGADEEETRRLVAHYRNHLPEIALRSGAEDTLKALQERGVAMAIVTDGRSGSQRMKIKALGLDRFVAPDMIFISEEVGEPKTGGKALRSIVSRFPEASGFFYVGDNPAKDFVLPNRLGWTTICLTDDGHNIHSQERGQTEGGDPQVKTDSLRDIIPLIIND